MKALELLTTCAVLAFPLVMACSNEQQNQPAAYGQMNVQPPTPDQAVDRIAGARCDLEMSCNNIGTDRRFMNRSACLDKQRGELAGHLRVDQCPMGIDARRLDTCVSTIRSQRCGNVLDSVGRMTACRTSDLCMR
jgi:hypothetical protein